eukprot:TRINITY_DN1425_c0_g1_i2.p1 TRINITY_DN1425_c0_g1~~TRINITY_DN1425_c0_g1_i2.p1  ORF type:complete len:582 (+),score=86.74 TRINITY_DN1425_c0_g1_i2:166-1911(+)
MKWNLDLVTRQAPDMATPPVLVALTALTILALFFRKRVDACVVRLLKPKRLDQQNEAGRAVWISIVCTLVGARALYVPSTTKDPMIVFCFVALVPLAILAILTRGAPEQQRFGWAVIATWLVGRLVRPIQDAALAFLPARNLLFVGLVLSWVELTVRSPSTLLLNHMSVNIYVCLFCKDNNACAALSAVMIGLFFFRRCSGQKGPLQDSTTRVSHLVQLVLQSSGDELCQESKQMLHDALCLLGVGPFKPNGSASTSQLGLGAGDGVGMKYEDPVAEADLATLMGSGSFKEACDSIGTKDEECVVRVTEDIQASPPVVPKCKTETIETAPPSAPPEGHYTPESSQLVCLPSDSRHGAEPCSVRFAERLVAITFDGMAHVKASNGEVLWTNHAFDNLANLVGGGDARLGMQTLQAQCLQQTAHSQYVQLFVNGGSFWVASKVETVFDGHGQQVLLWTTHNDSLISGVMPPPLPSPDGSPDGDRFGVERNPLEEFHTNNFAEGLGEGDGGGAFPPASQFPDPQCRVHAPPSGKSQRRRTCMLWQRYGKKTLCKETRRIGAHGKPETVSRCVSLCLHSLELLAV